jgi:hypothetical protein
MATTTTQVSGTIQSLLTTELNSLANNSLAIGSAITLTSTGYLLGEVELVVTYGTNPTASTGCSIWFLRDIDGTNYEDGGTSLTPARAPDLVIPVLVSTSAQRITRRCLLPPGTFKALLKNDGTGQALAASGNTLKVLPLTYQSA